MQAEQTETDSAGFVGAHRPRETAALERFTTSIMRVSTRSR